MEESRPELVQTEAHSANTTRELRKRVNSIELLECLIQTLEA